MKHSRGDVKIVIKLDTKINNFSKWGKNKKQLTTAVSILEATSIKNNSLWKQMTQQELRANFNSKLILLYTLCYITSLWKPGNVLL